MREKTIARWILFIMVTLIVGSSFSLLFYIAHLIEGSWSWWFLVCSYGVGGYAGYEEAKDL